MTSYRGCWWPLIPLCAAVTITTLGCSEDADPWPGPAEVATPVSSGCTAVDAGGGWQNQEFPEQRSRFTLEVDARPSADAIDAVVGLSAGSAASFTALAAIVRFNADGMIDVRAGSGYTAAAPYPYAAGRSYHLRIQVDVGAHTYSVAVREGSGPETAIATAYPFRTEQSGVTGLNHVASEVDSVAGPLEVCGVSVLPGSASTCATVSAGRGFVSVPLPDATGYETVILSAQPSGPNVDAVFGLSAGAATTYSQIAAAARFAPSGIIDFRDAGGYRADVSTRYSGETFQLRLISDLSTHTYSVFRNLALAPPQDVAELARQYRFRTEQAGVTHLDHLSAVVDGDHGSAIVCATVSVSSSLVYSREGVWTAAPFADDGALLSNGATTTRVDPTGVVLATIDGSGALATDPLGNSYIARVADGALTVDQYGPLLQPRWRAIVGVAATTGIRAIAGRHDGVTVAISTGDTTSELLRFAGDGSLATGVIIMGSVVGLSGDQAITTWIENGALRVASYGETSEPVWSRAYPGRASVTAIAVDPDHNVIFGGVLQDSIDFGGGPLPLRLTDDGPVNGFIVKLSSTGDHVFSRRPGYTAVSGIATNGPRIALSGTRRTQFFYHQLAVFDANNPPANDSAQLASNGRGGRVAMSPTGRVWWSREVQFQLFTAFPFLHVFR